MLACRSINLSPGDTALILVTLGLWVATCLLAIPNLCLVFREGGNPKSQLGNVVFFITYLLLSMFLLTGTVFQVSTQFGVVLIFLVPAMVIGHFIFLFSRWREERKSRRLPDKTPPNESTDGTS